MRCILPIETRFPSVLLYRRVGEAREAESYALLDDRIDLPEIAARLALADFYEVVAFEPGRAIP